jgi:putative acetyltransferase
MRRTPGFRVRDARAGDFPAIHAVHSYAVRRTCATHYGVAERKAWLTGRSPEGYLRGQARGERFVVAVVRSTVVGFASWRDDELTALFVSPSWQLHGIGHALVQACERQARRDGAWLRKVNSTLNARAFYQRLGFLVVSRSYSLRNGRRIGHYEMRRLVRPSQTV